MRTYYKNVSFHRLGYNEFKFIYSKITEGGMIKFIQKRRNYVNNILSLINSRYWVVVASTDDEITFTTERHEYTISKRPILGYRLTISSFNSIDRDETIFKDEEELISFIKSNKPVWEEKVVKPLI